MREQSEQLIEPKGSRDFWGWSYWVAVVVALYVLASGPIMRLCCNRQTPSKPLGQAFEIVYAPLGWAYEHTPLEKPLGMYWHLWDPRDFDKSGDFTVHIW
jgi:hypothetical protein